MGNPDRPELGEELTDSFCRTDPEIARQFARVTFLSDNRADLARVDVPTLVLQCTRRRHRARRRSGEYVARRASPDSDAGACSTRPGTARTSARPRRRSPRSRRSSDGARRRRMSRDDRTRRSTPRCSTTTRAALRAAPRAATSRPRRTARSSRSTQTFLDAGPATAASDLVGRRRFADLLTAGGRIYHETHYAPLLRMQGAVARDRPRPRPRRRQPAAGAGQLGARDATPTGARALIRIAVFDATDRRDYERELLRAKQRAEESEARAQRAGPDPAADADPARPAGPARPRRRRRPTGRPATARRSAATSTTSSRSAPATGWWPLGDVCGKGVEAAVVTALVRYTLRALSACRSRAERVLRGPQRGPARARHRPVLHRGAGPAAPRRRTAGWRRSRSGGHPLPLHVGRDGRRCGAVGRDRARWSASCTTVAAARTPRCGWRPATCW